MLNAIPVVGWFLQLVFAISMSVPFWFIWNRLAPIYFYWLPEVYKCIPFWHCVGLFIIIPTLKFVLVPQLSSVSNNSESKSKS